MLDLEDIRNNYALSWDSEEAKKLGCTCPDLLFFFGEDKKINSNKCPIHSQFIYFLITNTEEHSSSYYTKEEDKHE